MHSGGAPDGWCHAFSLSLLVLVCMDKGVSPGHVFWTQDVSRQTHLHTPTKGTHAAQTRNVVLPGTSIIFLYTFKKAASASLLLLLKASICKERGEKEWLIVSYTTRQLSVTSIHPKGRPINFTVRVVYISAYPHYA